MSRRFRVAYLVSHPIQYQVPMLRRITARPEIDLTVFFLSDLSVRGYWDRGFGRMVKWDVPLVEGYRHVFLPALGKADRLSFWRPFVYGLRRRLSEGRFDVLWIHANMHYACLWAVVVAKALGMKVLLRVESHREGQPRSAFRIWLKERVLPGFFRRVDAFLAIGTLNREYYLHYGVPESRIFTVHYAVDNDFFRNGAAAARPGREALRSELELEAGRPVILFTGKLEPVKRVHDLLDAYILLSPDGVREPRPYLLFVGDGEDRPVLESRVKARGWSSVRFLGFKNQTDLPPFYDLCDVFVLPSRYETWGLVVNEAANAGKPIVVSDRVGSSRDLVAEGENGFIVQVGDVNRLAAKLGLLASDPGLAEKMGQESLRRISRWSLDAAVEGFLHAVESVCEEKGRPSRRDEKRRQAVSRIP